MNKVLLDAERLKLMESWEHPGFNVDGSARIGADEAEKQPLGPSNRALRRHRRSNWARITLEPFELDM